jgi:hypothetical protein
LVISALFVRQQKNHGKGGRMPQILEVILQYGAHAKSVIPELKKYAAYWETQRNTRRPPSPTDLHTQVLDTIKKIEAMDGPPKDKLISISQHLYKKEKH